MTSPTPRRNAPPGRPAQAAPPGLARRIASRLPAPRGEALLAAGRSLRILVTGRGVGPMTILLQRVDARLERGDTSGALAVLAPAIEAEPWRRELLQRQAAARQLTGDLSGLIETHSRLQQLGDTTAEVALRRLAGLVTVTEPGWMPDLPDRAWVEPASPSSVTRLVLGTGGAPSQPTVAGEPVESVPVSDIRLVNPYPPGTPLPELVRGLTWLAVQAVARTRPALVALEVEQAALGDGAWAAALLARDLGRSLRIPVLPGAWPEPPPDLPGAERARATRERAIADVAAAFDAAALEPGVARWAGAERARATGEGRS